VLDGKVAIVTGASKGIGKGEAIALAKEGAKVAVLARTYDGDEGVVTTARELEALGASALPLQCDVCDVDQVHRAVADVVAHWGTVDVLVNNAQIIYAMHPCEDWTEAQMRATWESGLLGSWAFMVACFPHMKDRGGRIINTCSTTGHGNVPGYVGYSCTKEAVRALTRNAAREWAPYGINVNTISPTALSDIVVKTFPDETERLAALLAGGQVVGRWGDAELDVGRAVVFLAGPDSGLITGCTLSVDGGAAML
jgi:NAD(P)-dependent dehydrogenase (short-subunit alcohol dehydrogenase family)